MAKKNFAKPIHRWRLSLTIFCTAGYEREKLAHSCQSDIGSWACLVISQLFLRLLCHFVILSGFLSLWVSGNLDQCEMKEVNKLWLGQCYLSHPIAIGSLLVQLKSPKILNKNGTASQSQVEDSVQCVGLEIEKQRAQLSEKLCFQPFTTFRIATLLQTLRNWPGEEGGW